MKNNENNEKYLNTKKKFKNVKGSKNN